MNEMLREARESFVLFEETGNGKAMADTVLMLINYCELLEKRINRIENRQPPTIK
jgi:hypothetical protein